MSTYESVSGNTRCISNFPRSLKLLVDLFGLIIPSLRLQTIAQTGKAACVSGFSVEIVAKNFLRIRCTIGRE